MYISSSSSLNKSYLFFFFNICLFLNSFAYILNILSKRKSSELNMYIYINMYTYLCLYVTYMITIIVFKFYAISLKIHSLEFGRKMLLKTICLIFILNSFTSNSEARPVPFNILPELSEISNFLSNGYSQVKQYYSEGKERLRNYVCGLYKESETETETGLEHKTHSVYMTISQTHNTATNNCNSLNFKSTKKPNYY